MSGMQCCHLLRLQQNFWLSGSVIGEFIRLLNIRLLNMRQQEVELTGVARLDNVTKQLQSGKVNAYGWLRYSGFARHKDPQLDAAGALADLLVFSLNLTGLDILQKIENQDNSW